MKILMLTPYLPYPPSSGGQVRSYNLIKNLAKKHQITLFSLISRDEEKKYINELERLCYKVQVFKRPLSPWLPNNILKAIFGPYPLLVIRNFSEEEKRAIKKELARKKFDLIHAENFYVMPHLPKDQTPVFLTEQTIFYRVYEHFVESLPWYLFWLKPFLMVDVWKLRYWEAFYLKKADYLTAVSEEDREHIIKKLTGKRKVEIVPNGVDFGYYHQRLYKKTKKPTLLFGAADFHWMQNKEGAEILLRQVWPLVKEKVPQVKLWIVGKIAPDALLKYQGQKDVVIQEIKEAREAYQKAWVLVAPMRSGGGSRTKFFEAMASGLPIVTTPEGVEGIDVKSGQGIVVENDLSVLARKTVALLLNEREAKKIGLKGQKLVRKEYDWQESAKRLDKLYEKINDEQEKS